MFDVLHRHLCHFVGINLVGRHHFLIAGREGVDDILDAVPLIHATDFGFRLGISQELEHGREDVVLQNYSLRYFVSGRIPGGVSVEFRTGTHEHRCPVHTARRWKYGTLLECPATFGHQCLHVRHVGLVYTIRTPSVEADINHMFGYLLFGFRCLSARCESHYGHQQDGP